MKKILVPTDFSGCAEKALQYAAQIGKVMRAELVLLHVCDLLDYAFADKKDLVDAYNEAKIVELNHALQRLKAGTEGEGLAVTTKLYDGDVVDSIVTAAQEHQADLIVMGTLGNTGLKTLIFGTKTAAVIRESATPVIAIPHDYQWSPLKEILIAVDNTKEKSSLFEPVFALSRLFNATIRTVVFSEENAAAVDVMQYAVVAAEMQRKLEQQFPQHKIETNHLSGSNFHQTIHEYVEQERIGLLVMITYKRTFMQNLFRFSATRKMAHHTTVPLLSLQGTVVENK